MTYLAWLAVIGLIVALGETARRLYGRLRRHEKTLRESEARYRALLEHPDHIVLVLQAERDARGAVRDWVFRDANTRAAELIGNYRLTDTTVYSTIEPCVMCAGSLVNARVKRLVFGARDERFGAVETLYRICDDVRLNHRIEILGGVMADECRALMQDFFRARR